MVLDCIVRTSIQHFRDFGPFVVQNSVFQEQNPFFFFSPADFLNLRIQVVVPSFSALLASSVRQMLCYLGPLLRPVLFYELEHLPVLSLGPGSFDNQLRRILAFLLASIRVITSAAKLILLLRRYETRLRRQLHLLLRFRLNRSLRSSTCLRARLRWPGDL